jgi:hypothetical protein
MTDPMIPLSLDLADDRLLNLLIDIANDGMYESFFGSLNYSDAAPMADWLLSRGHPESAGWFMQQWVDNDEDWEIHNEDGDVDAWLALIPADQRKSS